MQLIKQVFGMVLLGALIWSAEAEAKERVRKATHTSIARKYTLEQLDSAAHLLVSVSDMDQPGFCGITPSSARNMLMALHPLIDEKRDATVASLTSNAHSKAKAIGNPKWESRCLQKCHCGLYASILEGVGETGLVPSDRALLEKLQSKARVMSREQMLGCARKSRWFCSSDLLAYLKEEAKNDPVSP